MQRYALPFSWRAGQTEVSTGILTYDFKPTNIRTVIEKPELGSFDGIYLVDSRVDIEAENQLMMAVDAYSWSSDLVNRIQREFYAEYGLTGKSTEEIQRYLDKHELSVPDPTKIMLPPLHKGQSLRFTGQFSVDCMVSIVGWART